MYLKCSVIFEVLLGQFKVKIADFQICFGARNLNEEQRSIILQSQHFQKRLQIHRCVARGTSHSLEKAYKIFAELSDLYRF